MTDTPAPHNSVRTSLRDAVTNRVLRTCEIRRWLPSDAVPLSPTIAKVPISAPQNATFSKTDVDVMIDAGLGELKLTPNINLFDFDDKKFDYSELDNLRAALIIDLESYVADQDEMGAPADQIRLLKKMIASLKGAASGVEPTPSRKRPAWWPKTPATKLRWKSDYRLIRPLHDNGLNASQISKTLLEAKGKRINRERVTHILEWAQFDPEAHS